MELFSHPFYTFFYDPLAKVIIFRWTPKTESMEMHDYQEALHNCGFQRSWTPVSR